MFADDEIDFTKCKSVEEAFTLLITELQDNIPENRLQNIKNRCIAVTDGKFRECIKSQADTINKLFTLLSENKLYCNWINILLVEIIAIASGCKKLKNLVDSYRKAIHSRTLKQVFKEIPSLQKNFSKYKDLIPISQFNDPDNIKVKELLTISRHLPIEVLAPHISVG